MGRLFYLFWHIYYFSRLLNGCVIHLRRVIGQDHILEEPSATGSRLGGEGFVVATDAIVAYNSI